MSRLGKKPIEIPKGVEVKIAGAGVSVKGPLGTLEKRFDPIIEVKIDGNEIILTPQKDNGVAKAMWGTVASHLSNMIIGVTKPYEKKLIIEGVGFKSEVKGNDLVMSLGFSHQVKVNIPKSLKVTAEKNVITVTGINKEEVGQFSATVRSKKKPEPYKGKGIRYEDEVIKRKQGKKTV